VFTATVITLDKALAKAAGFTAGDLAETFLASSFDQYRNPTLITAQYPPSRTAPAEARGSSGAGGAGRLHAVATDLPSAAAEAEAGQGGDGAILAVRHGTSSSRSELDHNGTVVTRAVAVASGVSIGGVVTIAAASTEAVTTVPSQGNPTTDLKVTLTGLLVGGVPAELTDQGLRISDQVPFGPGQLVAFNAATAQLAERGLIVTAAPAVRETDINRARAEGGAVLVRYRVTDQIGGDEEVVIADAHSRSTLALAEKQPSVPEPLPALTPAPVSPLGPVSTGLTPGGGAMLPPPARPDGGWVGDGHGAGAGSVSADTDAATLFPAGGPGAETAAPTDGLLNLVEGARDPAVIRLRTGYRVILLLAAAGAAVHFAAQRTRPT
jgi:hypothetical protein